MFICYSFFYVAQHGQHDYWSQSERSLYATKDQRDENNR